jgi:hypothetical protein
VQQLRPQLLMMQVRAKATLALEENRHDDAILAVEEGLEELRQFFTRIERPELLEQSAEAASLEAYLTEIRSTRPLSERERLEQALDEAIRREDYEKAAQLRDKLKKAKS